MSWWWKSVEVIKNKIFRARQGDVTSPPFKREVSALPLKWKQNHHLKLYRLPGDKTHTLRRAIHMSNQPFTVFWFRPILEGHDSILSLGSCISEYTWVHSLDYDQAFSTIKTTMPVSNFHTLVSDLLSRITWIILNFLTYYISAFIFTNLLTINIFFHLYQCSGVIIWFPAFFWHIFSSLTVPLLRR